jgi:zinc ribbon protein
MFCRYCGSHIAEDSLFCAKCGKKLVKRENPQFARIVRTLRLKTPYPYFALLIAVFIAWAVGPRQTRADYSHLKWSIELDKKIDLPNDNTFQQALSLVVENTADSAIQDVPIELSAKIEPHKPADVTVGFLGRKLLIVQAGHAIPLVVLLDRIDPKSKKRFFIEGSIQAEPPFTVTYEVREEDQKPVLASYVVEK